MINTISDSNSCLGSTENVILRQPERSTPLSEQVVSVSHSSINLHPKGVGNGYKKCQAISKEVFFKTVTRIGCLFCEKKVVVDTTQSMGYISDFKDTGEEAILIHGTKDGNVALLSHRVKDRKEFSVKEFISYIKKVHSIDLTERRSSPLHILSCYGTSNGVYQAFSDALKREVTGYGDGGVIATTSQLQGLFDENTTSVVSVIGDVEVDRPEDLWHIKASVHTYFPQAPGSELTSF